MLCNFGHFGTWVIPITCRRTYTDRRIVFSSLISSQASPLHSHYYYWTVFFNQTPGVPTKFLKSSSSFISLLTWHLKPWPWLFDRPRSAEGEGVTHSPLVIVYLVSARLDACRHRQHSWAERRWWLYASDSCSKTAIRMQAGARYRAYNLFVWDWQNYSPFPDLSSSSAADGCLKRAQLATVIYNLWPPRLQSKK